jgi:predicted porin
MNEYNLGIGMFVRDNLLIALGYGHEKEEFKDQVFGTYEVKNNLYSVSTKWVNEKNNGTALNIEGSIGLDNYDDGFEDGSNTVLGVAADYYFNPRMSVGAGLALNAGDDVGAEGNTLEIRSAIFFNPRFSVRAAFEQFFADNDNSDDEQAISFNLSTRF